MNRFQKIAYQIAKDDLHKDVWVYKKANALEYQDRTGKCMWGFKEKRRAYGYDEITGKELA